MGVFGNEYIFETRYRYNIDSDILLEFSLKESLSNVIRKIKVAIYKLLTKWEKALTKKGIEVTGLKGVLLKFVQKLKSLFKKTDDIKSIDDANKISKEFQDIKEQEKTESRKEMEQLVERDLANKDYTKFMHRIITSFYCRDDSPDIFIKIAKEKGFNIFEYAKKYREENGIEINNIEYKEPKSVDDFDNYISDNFVIIRSRDFSAFTYENYQTLKKEYKEYVELLHKEKEEDK